MDVQVRGRRTRDEEQHYHPAELETYLALERGRSADSTHLWNTTQPQKVE